MRVIIAGSRHFNDYDLLVKVVKESGFNISTVVSGCAKGADTLGEKYAIENNIPLIYFPANWNKFGKAAGYIRNEEMARNADALIAFLAPNSRGTVDMIRRAKEHNLKILIKNI